MRVIIQICLVFLSLAAPAADLGTCGFYLKLAQDLGCADHPYLNDFAYRYCREFDERQEEFTTDGQARVSQIKICLQQELVGDRELTCESVTDRALESHYQCYMAADFCSMDFTDQWLILDVVWPALEDPGFREVFSAIAEECVWN